MPPQREQRNYRADPQVMRRLRVASGMSVKSFSSAADIDRVTARKVLAGDPIFLETLKRAVENAFGIEDVTEVLHPDELTALGVISETRSANDILEWTIEKYLTGWTTTSNGLQFQTARLAHRFLEGRLARGKCYELRHLSDSDRERINENLKRHIEVCDRIDEHPNVARSITAAVVNDLWWVIDRWVDGETVQRRLQDGPFSEYELQNIMRGIARGLVALHEGGIIRRELNPSSIILRQSNDAPVLTDMELAKIISGKPTVSPSEWPDDPYRAPEVAGSSTIDESVDVYSWGRIFVHAALGQLPERGAECLDVVKEIPDLVKKQVALAVTPMPSGRKTDFDAILSAMETWR